MIGALVKLGAAVASIIDRLTAWAKQKSDQNDGRKLQHTDDLQASVKADHDAVQTREDVAGLSDGALDAELRGKASPDGK